MPHILITNDDGIFAPGLRALSESMAKLGEISIVAPSSERSGSAQALTVRKPVFWEKVADREWAVDGTPTDAVILAFGHLLPEKPDLVVSGINRGGNLGENVHYSGTVGAAREGAVYHIPSMAISVSHRGRDFDFTLAARCALELAPILLREGLPAGVLLNVNVPQPWKGGVRLTRQSPKITRNVMNTGQDEEGRDYFVLQEQHMAAGAEPGTDYAAVLEGAISITPLVLDHTHTPSLSRLSGWAADLESSLR